MSWQKLRKQVLERDNYTCQQCYESKNDLDAHHIFPKNKYGLDTLNNLVAVCRKCHGIIEPHFEELDKEISRGFVAPISKQGKLRLIIVPKSFHKSIMKFKNPLKVTIEEIVE